MYACLFRLAPLIGPTDVVSEFTAASQAYPLPSVPYGQRFPGDYPRYPPAYPVLRREHKLAPEFADDFERSRIIPLLY